MRFDHEQLDVYGAAIDLVALAHELIGQFPPGHGDLANQLRRAATSVPLNIAEGAGEYAPNEKARIYRIALRSATECAAILDVARRIDIVSHHHFNTTRDVLIRIVSMLTKMARSLRRSGNGNGDGDGNRAI